MGCPHPNCSHQESMCGVPPPTGPLFVKYVLCPPSPYTLFLCGVPPPLVLCLEHFGSVLDSEHNWESGKFQLARWSQAQLLSSSVAPLAELVFLYTFLPWLQANEGYLGEIKSHNLAVSEWVSPILSILIDRKGCNEGEKKGGDYEKNGKKEITSWDWAVPSSAQAGFKLILLPMKR